MTLIDGVSRQCGGQIVSVVADKGYDTVAIVDRISAIGAQPVIPPLSTRTKTARTVDWAQYKHRNLVERFFARLKHFRRVATRYDKLAASFAAFVMLAASYTWLA